MTDDGFLDGAVNCGRIMASKMEEEEEASRPPIVVAFKNGGNFCEDQEDRLWSIMKLVGRWRKKYTERNMSLAKIAILSPLQRVTHAIATVSLYYRNIN